MRAGFVIGLLAILATVIANVLAQRAMFEPPQGVSRYFYVENDGENLELGYYAQGDEYVYDIVVSTGAEIPPNDLRSLRNLSHETYRRYARPGYDDNAMFLSDGRILFRGWDIEAEDYELRMSADSYLYVIETDGTITTVPQSRNSSPRLSFEGDNVLFTARIDVDHTGVYFYDSLKRETQEIYAIESTESVELQRFVPGTLLSVYEDGNYGGDFFFIRHDLTVVHLDAQATGVPFLRVFDRNVVVMSRNLGGEIQDRQIHYFTKVVMLDLCHGRFSEFCGWWIADAQGQNWAFRTEVLTPPQGFFDRLVTSRQPVVAR